MASEIFSDFGQKLADLNSWQLEQQQKLKEFQKTQRELLNNFGSHSILKPMNLSVGL